jgi:hypothetical protein
MRKLGASGEPEQFLLKSVLILLDLGLDYSPGLAIIAYISVRDPVDLPTVTRTPV